MSAEQRAELTAELRRTAELGARREREARVAALTLAQLEPLPAETRVYRTMGRAFILGDMDTVRSRLRTVGETSSAEAAQAASRMAAMRTQLAATANAASSAPDQ